MSAIIEQLEQDIALERQWLARRDGLRRELESLVREATFAGSDPRRNNAVLFDKPSHAWRWVNAQMGVRTVERADPDDLQRGVAALREFVDATRTTLQQVLVDMVRIMTDDAHHGVEPADTLDESLARLRDNGWSPCGRPRCEACGGAPTVPSPVDWYWTAPNEINDARFAWAEIESLIGGSRRSRRRVKEASLRQLQRAVVGYYASAAGGNQHRLNVVLTVEARREPSYQQAHADRKRALDEARGRLHPAPQNVTAVTSEPPPRQVRQYRHEMAVGA